MLIQVFYFGSLREELGRAGESLAVPEGSRIIDAWHALNPDQPWPDNILCALNQDYVKSVALLHDGDELAFFPPVTGG